MDECDKKFRSRLVTGTSKHVRKVFDSIIASGTGLIAIRRINLMIKRKSSC